MTSKISRVLKWKNGFLHRDWWICLGIIVILLALYLPTYRTGAWMGREGVSLYGSVLTSEGKVPYRDFDSLYAPLTTYFHALIFTGGVVSVDRVRLLLIFVILLNALAIYVLSRRLLSPIQAGMVSLAGVAYYSFPPHNYSTLYAVLFSLITLLILSHTLESGLTPGRGFWIGLGTGLTSLIHHPVAVYLGLTVIASVVIAPYLSLRKARKYTFRDTFLFVAIFGLTWAGIVLPVYGIFASFSSWSTLLLQLFPPQISEGIGLYIPPLSYLIPKEISGPAFYLFCAGVFFWGTLLMVILTVILFLREGVHPSGVPVLYLLPLTLFQVLMESKNVAVGVPNLLYIQTTFVLAGFWGFESKGTSKRWAQVLVWCAFGGWVLFEVMSWAVTPLVGKAKPVYRLSWGQNTLYVSSVLGKDTGGVMKFIEENTKPNDLVAIFPDGTFLSAVTGRPNPFGTTIIDTGNSFVRTDDYQKKMIETLDRDRAAYVMILEWGEGYFARFKTNEVPIVSRYLTEKYEPVKTIGAVKSPLLSFVAHIYKRKAGSQQ